VAKSNSSSKTAESNPLKGTPAKSSRPNSASENGSPKVTAKMATAIRKDEGGIIGILHRHPAASIVIGVLATVLAIAAGVILLRPDRTASARDRSQTSGEPLRTVQSVAQPASDQSYASQ
jgi:hypothetical protein